MYDAIVVGARCAGAATALLLARHGHRVLLVDRASFPSDTLSTNFIHQPGVARLQRWGLLEEIIASNCPPVRQLLFDVGPFALVGSPPPFEGVANAYAPRRTVLDQVLITAAAAAGVEVRQHFSVRELLWTDGRVSGIRGQAVGGALVTETARVVIGADGQHSLVARAVQAPAYQVRPALACAYYAYWSDLPLTGAELYPRPERMIIAGPTNDGLVQLTVFWPHASFHTVRGAIEEHFWAALELVPALAERVRAGRQQERFRGTAELGFFFRQPYGPGWALVGDAGYYKDPITAQGITDAFRDAELLSTALADGWSGRRDPRTALAGYERQRNEAAMPLYELTYQLAALAPPPPDLQQLLAALRGNQVQTDRFFGTIAGTVAPADFYGPENIARILAGAHERAA